MKRVLLVHNYYQIGGGEHTVFENEKRLLEENGNYVVCYTRDNSELKKSIIKNLLLPFTTIFSLKTYFDVIKIIKKNKIEIVHCHNTFPLISPAVYYATLYCGIPVVQTVHNFRLLCPAGVFYRDGHICEDCVEKGLRCAVKHSCYRGSKIQTLICVISTKIHRMIGIYGKLNYICLTDFNKEKLLNLKQIKAEKIFVRPNFVENFSIKQKINSVKNVGDIIPAEQRKNQFVFVGRLDKLKGVDIMLVAWKLMGANAPKLVICGIGTMEDWCKQYIVENKINAEMLGFVPNKEVLQLIANSKALILPTQLYEGFPMSIAEAFSVGTPVVTSDLGNSGSLVTEGVTGCKFNADSSKDLMKAVICLLKYDNIYTTTAEEYEMKYTKVQNYESLVEIYSS